MNSFVIKNSKIVSLDAIYDNYFVYCVDGKIMEISQKINSGYEVIDAEGNYLAPGFIDLHIHGILGKCVDNGVDAFGEVTAQLPRFGVTGYLPTLAPRKAGEDAKYLESLAKADVSGAEILGFHLEGPFLSLAGALPPEAIGIADKNRVENLINAGKPWKVIFSISPEFKDIDTVLPMMAENNCPVFMTHTAAGVADTLNAISLGACHGTHFYDVFYSPAETDPGVRPCGAVEAILSSDQVSVDFILDGEHVDPVAVKMALKCKGVDKVCLISDASPGAGAKPGILDFAGSTVEIKYPGGPARDKEHGWLAGSGLTMNLAVANAVKMLGVDIAQAVRMASSNPAKVLGVDNVKGQIKEGYDADLIIFDENFEIKKTFVAGVCRYQNGDL